MSDLWISLWPIYQFLFLLFIVVMVRIFFSEDEKDRRFKCESCGTIQSSTKYNRRTNCVYCGRKLTKEQKEAIK